MDIRWIEDFLTVAEMGNFRRAAQRRLLSQPGLSRRIKALENWVGEELFDRGAQPVALTEAGRRFRPVADKLLSYVEEVRSPATDGISSLPSAPHGEEPLQQEHAGTATAGRRIEDDLPIVTIRPFTDLSGNESAEHVMASVATMLRDELRRVPYVLVADEDATDMAGDGADHTAYRYFIDGTFIATSQQTRITMQLSRSGRRKMVWSQSFLVTLEDLFATAEEVAIKMAWDTYAQVRHDCAADARSLPMGARSPFQTFIVAHEQFTSELFRGHQKAMPQLEALLKNEPDEHRLLATYGHCHMMAWSRDIDRDELLDKAEALIDAALDKTLAFHPALAEKAIIRLLHRDFASGEAYYARAVDASRNDPLALFAYAVIELFLGNYERSIAFFRNSTRADKSNSFKAPLFMAAAYYLDGRDHEAAIVLNLKRMPIPEAFALKLAALAQLGDKRRLATLRPIYRTIFTQKQRRFPSKMFPSKDPRAWKRWIEGFEKAGILDDVRIDPDEIPEIAMFEKA